MTKFEVRSGKSGSIGVRSGHLEGHSRIASTGLSGLLACALLTFGPPPAAMASDDPDGPQSTSPHSRQPGVGVPAKLPRPISGVTPGSGSPLQRKGTLLPPTPPRRSDSVGGGAGGGEGGGGGGGGRPPIVILPGDRPWGYGSGSAGYPWWWEGAASVDGSAGEDHWRVRAHLGSPVVQRAKRWYWWRYPYWGYSHWNWWNDGARYPIGYGWDYTDSFLETQAQREYERLQADEDRLAREEAERFERLSDIEKANELLSIGDAGNAIGYYVKHLEFAKDDAIAMRSLSLALVSSGKVDQACAMMGLAYEKSPILATQAINPKDLSGTVLDYRRLITDTVTHANKVKSASAWLTATALTQGEGRMDVARNMLAKAKQAGLSGEVLRQFELALRIAPPK